MFGQSAQLTHRCSLPSRLYARTLALARDSRSARPAYLSRVVTPQAFKGLVELGQRFWGNSAWFTSQRFLFRNVGDVFLLSVGRSPSQHVPLAEDAIEKALELPLDAFVAKPALLLQTILDHNCNSYCHDLITAARVQQRRDLSARQLPEADTE